MSSQIANNWKEVSAYGLHNFNADTFKIALMEPGFNFSRSSHVEYDDISAYELATDLGYTAGGQTLAGVAITEDSVLAAAIVSWNDVSWAVSGGELQACGAIIYDDSLASPDVKPIVGFIDFGGTLTTYDGGTFSIVNVAVAYT